MIEIPIPGWKAIKLRKFYPQQEHYYHTCEPQTRKWMVENVKPEWNIIDCGAHVGYHTILFSQLARMGVVFAFEPTDTYKMLRSNILANNCDNVWTDQMAIGAKTGFFNEPLYKLWGEAAETQTYEFTTLDDFVASEIIIQESKRLDCIKIDVDSFDYEALLGAEKILEHYNPWLIVELNDALRLRGHSTEKALEWLRKQGYDRHVILDGENYLMKRGMDVIYS